MGESRINRIGDIQELIYKGNIYKAIWIAFLNIFVLGSCESYIDIEVGILWQDDQHFNHISDAYVGILEGKWDSGTGFDGDLLDAQEVTIGTNTGHSFTISTDRSAHYTAFIFYDENDNDLYDEGYDHIAGYKYNWGESGGELDISLSAHY